MSFKEKLKNFINKYYYNKNETDILLNNKANSTHNHVYSDLTNVSTVAVVVTYTDDSTETLNLLKYTPPSS